MHHLERSASHVVKVKETHSGRVLERSSVDAAELVQVGGWQYVPASTLSLRDLLLRKTPEQLGALADATRGRVHRRYAPGELVDALLPFAESGEIEVT
jgi:predicted NAD/FAD-dependent oxidoreductase